MSLIGHCITVQGGGKLAQHLQVQCPCNTPSATPPRTEALLTTVRLEDVVGATLEGDPCCLVVHQYLPVASACCDSKAGHGGATVGARQHAPVSLALAAPEEPSADASDEEPITPAHVMTLWAATITRLAQGLPLLQGDATATSSLPPLHPSHAGLVSPLPHRPWLVVLSAASGKGLSHALYRDVWEPMMRQSHVTPVPVATTSATHAADLAAGLDTGAYSAIIAAGGDGVLFEVVNGLLGRDDWQTVRTQLDVGVLPGGSGNGVSRSLCYTAGEVFGPVGACFLTVRSRPHWYDIASVTYTTQDGEADEPAASGAAKGAGEAAPATAAHDVSLDSAPGGPEEAGSAADKEGEIAPHVAEGALQGPGWRRVYCLLAVQYGMYNDIDIESESMRWLGAERFTAQGIIRTLWSRSYGGRVWYVPEDDTPSPTPTHARLAEEAAERRLSPAALPDLAPGAFMSEDHPSVHRAGLGMAPPATASGPALRYGAAGAPLQGDWKSLVADADRTSLVSIAKVPFISYDINIAPDSTLADGVWHMQHLPPTCFCESAPFLLGLDEAGGHLTTPCAGRIQTVRARAFRIECGSYEQLCCCAACCTCCPDKGATDRGGHWVTVDGNTVPDTIVQGEIHPGLLRILAAPAR